MTKQIKTKSERRAEYRAAGAALVETYKGHVKVWAKQQAERIRDYTAIVEAYASYQETDVDKLKEKTQY